MAGESIVEPVDDAGMLDPSVREEEAGPDGADPGELRPSDHLAEPARVDHLGVVIEKEQQLLLDRGRSRIHEGGEAEPSVSVGNP